MAVNSSKRRRQPTTKAPGRINNSQVISISSVTILAAALFLCSFNFDNIGKWRFLCIKNAVFRNAWYIYTYVCIIIVAVFTRCTGQKYLCMIRNFLLVLIDGSAQGIILYAPATIDNTIVWKMTPYYVNRHGCNHNADPWWQDEVYVCFSL